VSVMSKSGGDNCLFTHQLQGCEKTCVTDVI